MRIIRLTAENFKRLTAVEITPEGNIIRVSGKNAAGKSSVLDAIWSALGGEKAMGEAPLRRGAKKGEIIVDLGDVKVRRGFTEQGTTLTVTNAEGMKFPSPQKMLDALVGRLTFDPVEFMRMKGPEQVAILRKLVPLDIDLDKVDAEIKQLYDERTLVNREHDRLQAVVQSAPNGLDMDLQEQSSSDILTEIDAAGVANDGHRSTREVIEGWLAKHKARADRITALNTELDTLLREQSEAEPKAKGYREKLEALKDVDVAPLKAKLANVEQHNQKAREAQKVRQARTDADAKAAESKRLTEKMDQLKQQKLDALAGAKFPYPGLSFEEGQVVVSAEVGSLPLSVCSQAEQIKISMAIAMALNPKLRIVRITDGSLLDSNSLRIIGEMAAEHDYQCWIEQVDETGQVGIVIEDGHVAVKEKAA